MGLFSKNKPKIKSTTTKKDGFSGWLKCTNCLELIHAEELERNINCCPKCSYHYRLSPQERLRLLTDTDSFTELFQEVSSCDPLGFVDTERYKSRLENAKEKSGSSEAIIVGVAKIANISCAIGVMDFSFLGGSMGSCVGERLCRLIEFAEEYRLPLVIVTASGGARMQESTLSLMQMAKTSGALAKFHDAGLGYISIITNPTTGGVTASFASLADIIIAEPQALICFAGPRVIEQVLGKPLPEGVQLSEFLLEHGMIDMVVDRHKQKEVVGQLFSYINERKFTPSHKGRKRWQVSIS
jgi:acetyl-CoA carboxylase carboxyl transferase subunit beta